MTGRREVDAVVTDHLDAYRSGVARFNELLAEQLGVPLLPLGDPAVQACSCSLLSFKASVLVADGVAAVRLLLGAGWTGELFLHEFDRVPVELELVERASRVHCGNLEIYEAVRDLTDAARLVWAPGLIRDNREFPSVEISVLTLGMAHKMQLRHFVRLRELLDASRLSYSVYVSAANHETASLRDSQSVIDEMQAIFGERLYFLGNLSDVAVSNWLRRASFFAAFFPGGVRANNTTVAWALERGAIVITNLDDYSPGEYVHLDNVIDVTRCERLPLDPAVTQRLSESAVETAGRHGWDVLVKALRE